MSYDEVIEERFESLLSRYQIGLEASMKGKDFIFNGDNFHSYKCHKISFKRGGSYIDSLDWIKKATKNQKNCNDTCFPYAAMVTINREEIRDHLGRFSNIKPFINQHNWEGIKHPSGKDDAEKQ